MSVPVQNRCKRQGSLCGTRRGTYAEVKRAQTLKEADALDLVFPQRALDEAPGIVELCLDGDMGL